MTSTTSFAPCRTHVPTVVRWQSTLGDRVTVGTLDELRREGCLTGKAGRHPVCVFWSEGAPYALDDRCPHMGFPLDRGSIEDGILTCHWHHARFDLSSGGTFNPFADAGAVSS